MSRRSVTLTPDFDRLIAQFSREAKLQAEAIGHRIEGSQDSRLEVLRCLQTLMASLTICAMSIRTSSDVKVIQDLLEEITKHAHEAADNLDDLIQSSRCDVCGDENCNEAHATL